MYYQQAIDFLRSLPDAERGTKGSTAPSMSLATMRRLLARLGNPQDIIPAIHITGSKGKGSTATLIGSALKSLGYKTALYTSPHLHSYRERIAFDLEPVSELEFARGLTKLQALLKEETEAGGGPFSTFGVLTALFYHLVASRASSSDSIDWQIVEVGLGGTEDATNVFERKDVAVITAISLEHTSILGNSIADITKNKAGIITPGCTTVLAPQKDPSVRNIVREQCRRLKSNFVNVSDTYTFNQIDQSIAGQSFILNGLGATKTLSIQMLGEHQMDNAITALAAVKALERDGLTVSDEAIEKGLAAATVPGRFEILSMGSAANAGSGGSQKMIVLDGAHNQDSARALCETIGSIFPERSVILILGVNADKNVESIWLSLKARCKKLIATKSDNPRSLPPSEIVERLKNVDPALEYSLSRNIQDALDTALSLAENADIICVTGSLYLVAEARDCILKRQQRLVENALL